MFGIEQHAVLPHIEGMELETAEWISKNTKPVVSTADVIRFTTTNGRGTFLTPNRGFASERWAGLKDSLALSTALGLMEALDRRNEGAPDSEFREEALEELQRAKTT